MEDYVKEKIILIKMILVTVEEFTMRSKKADSRKAFLTVLNQYAKGVNRKYNLEELFDIGMDDVIYSVLDIPED